MSMPSPQMIEMMPADRETLAFSIQSMLMRTPVHASQHPQKAGMLPFDHASKDARSMAELILDHLQQANYQVFRPAAGG